jgi:RNA polymerase sigma-70 factor (ECF subfamily)
MDEGKQKQIFDEWLSQHKGLFFKVVRAFAFNAHDQDDLFQEISLQVWHSIPNFRGEAKVSTWIYRVALFVATAWSRRERKHQAGKRPLESVEHTLVQKGQETDGRLNWLYEQIAQLNEIDRALMLLLLDGFSYQEMSGILGISESNVGIKIHRIKKHLTQKSEEITHHGV